MDFELEHLLMNLSEAQKKEDKIKVEFIHKEILKYQKTKEWIQNIVLPDYELIVQKLISLLVDKDINLMLWKNSKISKSQRTFNEGKNIFAICIKNICSDRREMLFDILHEFGHAMDIDTYSQEEIKSNILKRQKREITAWLIADEEFIKISDFKADFNAYENYKWQCLESYGIFKKICEVDSTITSKC